MSDVSYNDKLEDVYYNLKRTVKFFFIGWLMVCCGFLLSMRMHGTLLETVLSIVFMVVGCFGFAIMAWPILSFVMGGGALSKAMSPSYEVVTTYKDGRKESDHGAESAGFNLLSFFLWAVLLTIPGFIIQAIKLIYFTIKYIVLFVKAETKPNFFHTGFFTLILGVIGLAVGLAAGSIVSTAYQNKEEVIKYVTDKEYRKSLSVSDYTPEEIRSMIAKVKKQFADDGRIDYYVSFDKVVVSKIGGDIGVAYVYKDNMALVKVINGNSQYLEGDYHFEGTDFYEFESPKGKKASQKDIEKAKSFLPSILIWDVLDGAKDEDLFAKDDNKYNRVIIKAFKNDKKKKTEINFYGNGKSYFEYAGGYNINQ